MRGSFLPLLAALVASNEMVSAALVGGLPGRPLSSWQAQKSAAAVTRSTPPIAAYNQGLAQTLGDSRSFQPESSWFEVRIFFFSTKSFPFPRRAEDPVPRS